MSSIAESLLNDGTAFVVFKILNKAAVQNSISAQEAILTFARLSLGGNPVFEDVASYH